MKTTGVSCETKFGLLGFLGHPTSHACTLEFPSEISIELNNPNDYFLGTLMHLLVMGSWSICFVYIQTTLDYVVSKVHEKRHNSKIFNSTHCQNMSILIFLQNTSGDFQQLLKSSCSCLRMRGVTCAGC